MRRCAVALSLLACAALAACSGGSSVWGQSAAKLAKQYHVCADTQASVKGDTVACVAAGATSLSLTSNSDADEQDLFVAMIKDNQPGTCIVVVPGFVIAGQSPLAMEVEMRQDPESFARTHHGRVDGFCFAS